MPLKNETTANSNEKVRIMTTNKYVPNSFQTPNVIIDRFMHLLTNPELRVLMFMIRHILGWHDRVESKRGCIPQSWFTDGVDMTNKNGETTHYDGCGISNIKVVRKALGSLRELGFIDTVDEKGNPKKDDQGEPSEIKGPYWELSFLLPDGEIQEQSLLNRQAAKQKAAQLKAANMRSHRKLVLEPTPFPEEGQAGYTITPTGRLSHNPPSGDEEVGCPIPPSIGYPITPSPADSLSILKIPIQKTQDKTHFPPPPDAGGDGTTIKISPATKGAATKKLNQARKSAPIDETDLQVWQRVLADQERVVDQLVLHHANGTPNPTKLAQEQAVLQVLQERDPRKASGAKRKRHQPPTPEQDPLYYALAQVYKIPPAATGKLWDLRHLFAGTSIKGEWGRCRLDPGATADEVRGWVRWRQRKSYGEFRLPQIPADIQKSFCRFRADKGGWQAGMRRVGATPPEPVKSVPPPPAHEIMPGIYTMPVLSRKLWLDSRGYEYDPETIIPIGDPSPERYVGGQS